jgi:hypothetical protein
VALHKPPTIDSLQITNEAIETLLDWIEDQTRTESPSPAAAPSPAADEHRDAEHQPSRANARYGVFRSQRPEPDHGVVLLARSLAPRGNPSG